jgi:hypothetical protein
MKLKISFQTTPTGYSLLHNFNTQFSLSALTTTYPTAPESKTKYFSTIEAFPLITNFTSPAEFQGPDSWDVILNGDIMNGITTCEDSYHCKMSILDEIELSSDIIKVALLLELKMPKVLLI